MSEPATAIDPGQITRVYTAPAAANPPPLNFPLPQVSVYVGTWYAARDLDCLRGNHILGVLNVAYDVDDLAPPGDPLLVPLPDPFRPPPPPPPTSVPLVRYQRQFAKVSLIDGTGNPAGMMGLVAAIYTAEQLFFFPELDGPCPPLVNHGARGNLLIHCWAGGSRSVTVAALYVWYRFGATGADPSLRRPGEDDEAAFLRFYDQVKAARGDSLTRVSGSPHCLPQNPGGVTEKPPQYGMQADALQVVRTFRSLFPYPVSR